jgi:hypothetical protein
MNRPRTPAHLLLHTLAFVLAASGGLAACKKDDAVATPPDDGAGATTKPDAPPAEPSLPPQDEPPAELSAIRAAWVNGDFATAVATAETVLPTLEGDTKVRARVWVASWLAMAHAVEFPQNARPHAELAVREAARLTGDGDAVAIAHYALGAVLVAEHHHEDAQQTIEKGAAAGSGEAEIGKLVLAEAILNQGFDDEDRLVDKTKIERARTLYDALASASQDAVIKGRAQVGVAATSKYLGDKVKLCEMAKAAQQTYTGTPAGMYLTEVPELLAKEASCK